MPPFHLNKLIIINHIYFFYDLLKLCSKIISGSDIKWKLKPIKKILSTHIH